MLFLERESEREEKKETLSLNTISLPNCIIFDQLLSDYVIKEEREEGGRIQIFVLFSTRLFLIQDVIFGFGGNDFIFAGAGNDCLYGGLNRDRLYGENGNDVIDGEDGNDLLFGGLLQI